ncbi:MAG: hypothetical protein AAFY11_05280 [Cyanobacteria bacterium J06641_5]
MGALSPAFRQAGMPLLERSKRKHMKSARIERVTTRRFADPWLFVALAATGFIVLAGIAAPFFQRQLLRKEVWAYKKGETDRIGPIVVQPQRLGALRIEVVTSQPGSSWAIYEIRVLDETGEPIVTGIKETWRGAGSARQAQPASQRQDDLTGGLDLKIDKPQSLSLEFAVLDAGFAPEQTSFEEPIKFRVTVHQGVIDRRYLWAGAIGSGVLTVLTMLAERFNGTPVIDKTLEDSEARARAIVGGPNSLVRVTAKTWLDETRPSSSQIQLRVMNEYGEPVYSQLREIGGPSLSNAEASLSQASWLLVFDRQGSYCFSVDVAPDGPVERTTLCVRDRARTRGAAEVITIAMTQSE